MHVKLIAISRPVSFSDAFAGDEVPLTPGDLIAYCARVSNPANQANYATAPKLLAYLVKHEHWSPFEMASMTLEIVTTRDIARQILRHRSFSFQEFSQRYAAQVAEPIFREARLQDAKNRQASIITDDQRIHDGWAMAQREVAKMATAAYQDALANGIAKEVARAVLPEGLTESRLYMAGTIRSWIHYCKLRTQESTQREHREVALCCEAILMAQFPMLAEVLDF